MGFRVAILSRQLSPSGSGVQCSQPPWSSSGNHVPCYTVPDAGAQGGTCSSVGPCFREWTYMLCGVWVPGGPYFSWSHEHSHPHREQAQRPRTSKCQKPRGREVTPSSKVLYLESLYQESNFSICPSEMQKSAAQHSQSQFSSEHLWHLCLARQAPTAPWALLPSSADWRPGRQTSWLTHCRSLCRPLDKPPLTASLTDVLTYIHPNLNARLRTSFVTLPMVC